MKKWLKTVIQSCLGERRRNLDHGLCDRIIGGQDNCLEEMCCLSSEVTTTLKENLVLASG